MSSIRTLIDIRFDLHQIKNKIKIAEDNFYKHLRNDNIADQLRDKIVSLVALEYSLQREENSKMSFY